MFDTYEPNRSELSVGVDGSRAAQVVVDEATSFQMFLPIKTRNSQYIAECVVEFVGEGISFLT